MKKKEALLTLTALAVLGLSGCGTKELALVSDHVEVELGSELDTTVTNYVTDEKVAEDAALDFSAVDTSKVGTYTVPVTYNDQTASFEVEVVDTVAPVVVCEDTVTVEVNTPLSAESVITSVTELSGAVEVTIAEPEVAVDEEATEEATEMVESTELAEDTEAVELEATEAMENTEAVEETEAIEDTAIVLEPFTVEGVLCSNDYVIFAETGEYDTLITVADASGNTTEALVRVVVGEAPVISGVEDITVSVGADEVDYLNGVTAVDCNGNDITDKITCDSSVVDLENVGEYGIVYTVEDENGFKAYETAIITVKEKSSGRTASNTGSKPNSTTATASGASGTASSTSGSGSSNASETTSSTSESGNGNASGATSSTSGSGSSNASGTTSSTSGATSTITDSSNQASINTTTPDTSNQTTSADTTTTTTTTPNVTESGPDTSLPDGFGFGEEIDDSLMDNTGTGGNSGGGVVGGGNF